MTHPNLHLNSRQLEALNNTLIVLICALAVAAYAATDWIVSWLRGMGW